MRNREAKLSENGKAEIIFASDITAATSMGKNTNRRVWQVFRYTQYIPTNVTNLHLIHGCRYAGTNWNNICMENIQRNSAAQLRNTRNRIHTSLGFLERCWLVLIVLAHQSQRKQWDANLLEYSWPGPDTTQGQAHDHWPRERQAQRLVASFQT